MVKGIDVSSWQGVIDWPQVRAAGYEFAFIRSSRGDIVDDCFATNWQNAQTAGVLVALYHVVYDTPSAAEQVALLLSLLPLDRNFPIVLDVEVDPPAAVLQRTREMLNLLEDYHAVIYTGAWWWDPATAGQDVEWALQADLWTASYTAAPFMPRAPWEDWRVWQYTNKGRVNGITGDVDLNEFNGDDLREWWTGTLTVELTEPVSIYLGNRLLLRVIPPHIAPPPSPQLPVLRFSQTDPRWKDHKLGATLQTVGGWGCAMVCACMVYSQHDPTITPKEFNDILTRRGGYNYLNGAAHLAWDRLLEIFPALEWVGRQDWNRRLTAAELQTIKDKLRVAPLPLWVDFKPVTAGMDTHFVLGMAYADGDIQIYDPWGGDEAWLLKRYAVTGQDLQRAVWGYRELRVS